MIFVAAFLFSFLVQNVRSGKEHIAGACHDPLYFGSTPCDKQWSIRYYMDVPTETCLAFNFTGCGDNWNNFASSQACYEECLPLDHHKCPAASKIHKTTKGRTACTDDCDCGVERYCDIGQGHGQCCELEYKDQVDSDYNPPCPPGQAIVRENLNGITVQLLVLPPQCTEDPLVVLEKSKNCTVKAELKFHFDSSTGFCMNFLWDGCSGNQNMFNSIADCVSTCLKNNYKGCPFQKTPIITSHCNNKNCNRLTKSSNALYCTVQGICCETKDLKELRAAFNVSCLPKRQKVLYTYKSTKRLLIGKSCDYKMCPQAATCHQNKYFAFCCQ